jgi:hypothetical protein
VRLTLHALSLAGLLVSLPVAGWAQGVSEKTLQLTVVDGQLPAGQRLIKVDKGDQLRWRISSNTAGELHLHAYRLSVKLQAGQATELAFTAFATGKFRVEWHGLPDRMPPSDAHHAPALATLEVRPR